MNIEVKFDSLGGGYSNVAMAYLGAPSQAKVTLGFKPKKLYFNDRYSTYTHSVLYDEDVSTTTYQEYNPNPSTSTIGPTSGLLASIDDDGFTFGTLWSGMGYVGYMAVG